MSKYRLTYPDFVLPPFQLPLCRSSVAVVCSLKSFKSRNTLRNFCVFNLKKDKQKGLCPSLNYSLTPIISLTSRLNCFVQRRTLNSLSYFDTSPRWTPGCPRTGGKLRGAFRASDGRGWKATEEVIVLPLSTLQVVFLLPG